MSEKKKNKWWKRLTSPTPDDFRKMRKVANRIGATALAIIGLSAIGLAIPPVMATVCTYVIVGCVCITGTSSFAKKD